jgi:hypothetical protein
MRAQRQSTSNDGFLLNITSLLLNIANQTNMFRPDNVANIDPIYCIAPSRLDLREETRV